MTKGESIAIMRKLTERNIPFKFGFITCNTSNKTSKGYKVVNKALLRGSHTKGSSTKSGIIIPYTDVETNQDRNFYLPLLMMFNDEILKP